MKTLTASFRAAMDSWGASPINLLEIDVPLNTTQTSLIGTLRYSDAPVSIENTQYQPLVIQWPGRLYNRVSGDLHTPDISDVQINLNNIRDNDLAPTSRLFLTRNLEGARMRMYRTFTGLVLADRDQVFQGEVKGPISWTEIELELNGVSGKFKNKLIGERISKPDYSSADTDVYGRIKPIVYGNVEKSNALAVGIGAFDVLASSATIDTTTLGVSDVSRFPASGPAKIGTITISYSGVNSILNYLTGVTGVVSVFNKGDAIWEVRTTYDYMVAGHAVQSIGNVWVNELLAPSTAITKDLANGLVKFLSQPIEQFLSEHLHAVQAPGLNTLRQYPTGHTGGGSALWYDGLESISAQRTADVAVHFSNTSYGIISDVFYWVMHSGSYADHAYVNDSGGRDLGAFSTWAGGNFQWQRFADPAPGSALWSDDLFIGISATIKAYIAEIYKEIVYVGATVERAQQIPALDFWRSAKVTADVYGYVDNTGSFTNVASTLIQRPDHIIKHLLVNVTSNNLLTEMHSSFIDAGSQFAVNSYIMSGVITEQDDVNQVLARLAFQSRCWFLIDDAGKPRLIYRQRTKTTDKVIDNAALSGEMNGQINIQYSQSPTEQVFHRISVLFNRDWSKEGKFQVIDNPDPFFQPRAGVEESFKDMYSTNNLFTRNRFGFREKTMLFDFVVSSLMAKHVVDYYAYLSQAPRSQFQFTTRLSCYDIERGDWIEIAYPGLDLYNQKFEVIEVEQSLEQRQMRFTVEGPELKQPVVFGKGLFGRKVFGAVTWRQ